jgi:disulfide oxidoreductase YuzD
MSEGHAIMELTTKGQEIMAKMADLHAEQTAVPTFKELQNEFEALIKAKHPDETLATTYTRCYGIALAHLTKAQMTEMVRLQKEYN